MPTADLSARHFANGALMPSSADKVPHRGIAIAPLTVRMADWEPAWGVLNRLAVRRGQADPRAFLDRARHCKTWLAKEAAQGRCIEQIATLSGFPMADLEQWTPRVMEGGTVLGRALVTATERFNVAPNKELGRGRVCPRCLLEDRENRRGPDACRAYRRSWWSLPEFSACATHRVLLSSGCPNCRSPRFRINVRPDVCSCGFDLAVMQPIDARDGIERQLHGMIVGTQDPVWSRGMSLRAVTGLTLRAGVVDLLGPKVRSVEMIGETMSMELSAEGWKLLAGGIGTFRALLDKGAERGDLRSPVGTYGELFRWLTRTGEPGLDIYRDELLAHATEHLRPKSDKMVFGSVVPARPVSRKRLVREHGGSPGQLCDMLGINRPQLVKLLASDGDRYRLEGLHARYDMTATASFLDGIGASARSFKSVPLGMARLMDGKRVERRWPETLAAVRSGLIQVQGVLAGRKGLYALLVSAEAVRMALPQNRAQWEYGMTCAQACKRLIVRGKTLTALRRNGLLEYVPCMSPLERMSMGPSVLSVETFERRYVSGLQVASAYGIGLRKLCRLLDERGAKSIIEFKGDVSPIFVIAEVLSAFGPNSKLAMV